MYGTNENVIEFLRNDKKAVGTFTQGRFIRQAKILAKSHPDEVRIIAENPDGSMCVEFPTSWVKLRPPRAISEEDRAALVERAKKNLVPRKRKGDSGSAYVHDDFDDDEEP